MYFGRHYRIPNSQFGAGSLAIKALLYGTALCGAGFLATGAVVTYAIGVRDVSFALNGVILFSHGWFMHVLHSLIMLDMQLDGLAHRMNTIMSPMRRTFEGMSDGSVSEGLL